MNPLAGLLIEYFVIGAVAAPWAVPELLKTPLFLSSLAKEAVGIAAATLTPVIYLLGMCCDLIGALYDACHAFNRPRLYATSIWRMKWGQAG